MKPPDSKKYRDLLLSLVFDAIGSGSLLVPVLGDLTDLIWAPVSAGLMVWMYKGAPGKWGGLLSFFEEIIPMTDFVPSFTLMWFYTYVLPAQKDSASGKEQPKTDSVEDTLRKRPEKR